VLPEWSVTLVVALLLVGFPLALFPAWAFEHTPEGLNRERDVDQSQPTASRTRPKLDFLIIGVLTVAVTIFAVDKFMLEPALKKTLSDARAQCQGRRSANQM